MREAGSECSLQREHFITFPLVLHSAPLQSAVLTWAGQLGQLRDPSTGAGQCAELSRDACSHLSKSPQSPSRGCCARSCSSGEHSERWGGSSKVAPSPARCWQSKTQPNQKRLEVAFAVCIPGCCLTAVPSGQGLLVPCKNAKGGEMQFRAKELHSHVHARVSNVLSKTVTAISIQ